MPKSTTDKGCVRFNAYFPHGVNICGFVCFRVKNIFVQDPDEVRIEIEPRTKTQ
jgi:hypothetical protein